MESNKLKFPVGLIGIAAGAYAIYYFAKNEIQNSMIHNYVIYMYKMLDCF
jgi:hypothetical protein